MQPYYCFNICINFIDCGAILLIRQIYKLIGYFAEYALLLTLTLVFFVLLLLSLCFLSVVLNRMLATSLQLMLTVDEQIDL